MPIIQDLEITRQLLPLINFTHNRFAQEMLTGILQDLPPDKKGVLEKQAVIRTIIDNGYVHTKLTYHPHDFEEVYHFLQQLQEQAIRFDDNNLVAGWQLWRQRSYRFTLRAKLAQAVLFFEQVDRYFRDVQAESFAGGLLAEPVTQLKTFLKELDAPSLAPEVRQGNNRLADEVRLLQLFSRDIRLAALQGFWRAFFLYEAWHSLAQAVVQHNWCLPVFQEEGIHLRQCYHPLLRQPVKNDLHSRARVLLLTGPNMSGKSTLLKTLGLCVYLAHAGMGVPAAACSLPFFDDIAVVIQLNDDLRNGYSHFMMEVQHLKQVVQTAAAGRCCFAVFDELFRGTNVDDALELSVQTIGGLATFPRGFFVISTHLYQLKQLLPPVAAVEAGFIECSLEGKRPVFAYRLQSGWSDLKIGKLIFEQEGLPLLLQQAAVSSLKK
ncbi:MutS-related protein [Chitinophaga vietnamensis]|uniref:MutS-related protein n=1 Tax=Chitinophaga vietnamensis TaxID=2593957 RepID=UPI001178AA0F|nr:hypothetical protein [Chitinophaga vietnamensis]